MKQRQKSPEQLEAQVGSYILGDTVPGNFSRRNVGKMITQLLDNDLVYGGSAHVDHPYATKQDFSDIEATYIEHIRNLTLPERESLRQKADCIANYSQFSTAVDAIKCGDSMETIGGGSMSTVFKIHQDGQDFAVRLSQEQSAVDETDKHLEALLRVRGIPHIEQMIAASYQEGVTISEFLPGKQLPFIDTSEIRRISQRQVDEFYDALVLANQRGVGVDAIGNNILYDKDKGFGFSVVDVGLLDDRVYCNVDDALFKAFAKAPDANAWLLLQGCLRNTLKKRDPKSPMVGYIEMSTSNLMRVLDKSHTSV